MRFSILPLLALSALPVFADQYSLTVDTCTGTCGASPFGVVEVVQNGANTVHVEISLTAVNLFILTGNRPTVGFNLVGNPTIAISNVTLGFSLVSTTAGALFMNGALGSFEYGLNCCEGKNGGANSQGGLEFDVTAPGLTPAAFAELSVGANTPSYFAVDIFNIGDTQNTGVVGAPGRTTGTPGVVPEPGSVILLSTTFALCGYLLRRRGLGARLS